jgi:hypothetical protein
MQRRRFLLSCAGLGWLLMGTMGCAVVGSELQPHISVTSVSDLGRDVEVTVAYSGVRPKRTELNIGLGYNPPPEIAASLPPGASSPYLVLHREVLRRSAGVVTVRLEKRRLVGEFSGIAHANLSEHPHSQEWQPFASARMRAVTP